MIFDCSRARLGHLLGKAVDMVQRHAWPMNLYFLLKRLGLSLPRVRHDTPKKLRLPISFVPTASIYDIGDV